MKERPILFNGPMVRAILEGRKTQTRRVIKPQPEFVSEAWPGRIRKLEELSGNARATAIAELVSACPYGVPGALLWVRETWAMSKSYDDICPSELPMFRRTRWPTIWYDSHPEGAASISLKHAYGDDFIGRRRPSIHMPRWASRITLRVTNVRVERVQEISEEDARAEGDPYPLGVDPPAGDSRQWFFQLWDSINAKRGYGWDVNPWVWVVEFERIKP